MSIFLSGIIAGVVAALMIVVVQRRWVAHRTLPAIAARPAVAAGFGGEQFSVIFNTVPVAIMLMRISDAQIVAVNAAFTELWKYTRAEALGRTGSELLLWMDSTSLIEQLKQNRHSDMQELQIRRKDGEQRDVLATVTMTQVQGQAHLLITAADVTDRNRARQLEHIAHHDSLTEFHTKHR